MKRPKIATIKIQWLDKNEEWQFAEFDQTTLEEAEELISLMNGNITEEDLKP